MKHQKSDIPTVEEHRATAFLLGLVLVLSVLYVAFQYNSAPQDMDLSDQSLDDLVQDIELHPAMDDKEMVNTMTVQPPQKTFSERIKAVDQPLKQQIEKLSASTTSPLLVGDGEAEALNAKLSAALPPIPVASEQPLNFRIVQQMPEFPGGGSAFIQWLTRQLRYPPLAQSQRIQGRVVVSFIVNKDGSIADVKLEKSVNALLDREALRVIRMMPRWKPGVHNNQPCRTMVAVPVVFKI
ncbi:TonB protein, C-terminal domain protein [Prevotella sp. BV3P1]|uniref:energy transducer TonB n=1 Tax=Prevotella sp. BV3P1 TaxID=1111130 RepID=UPI0003B81EED|nr:energy transducer TonB [Prevotella sp. BV3P1]ERT61451.1 TonB protein, C-terminal domain protein [Prevotella sp. BV3P1]